MLSTCYFYNSIITCTVFSFFPVLSLLKHGLRPGELLMDGRPWGKRREKQEHMETLTLHFSMYPSHHCLGFSAVFGLSKKPNLSDNVNVSVASARLCRFAPDSDTRLTDWHWGERGRSRCLCCLWPIVQNTYIFLKGWSSSTPPPLPPIAALTFPVTQFTVNL